MEGKKNLRTGQKVAEKALVLESVLAAAKAVIGFLSGSVVLISDAIHSGSDLVSIFTSWLGLKIAQKESDRRFPYGYYKAENIATAMVSLLIIFAFLEMARQGWARLFSPEPVRFVVLAVGISLADAVILFFFGRYEIRVGEKIGAQSLVAMGRENRTHLLSSSAVLVGILGSHFQIPYMEGLITLGIALLILKIGLEFLKSSLVVLMDTSPGVEVEDKVEAAVGTVAGVEEVVSLRLRRAGPFVFGEVRVGVRRSLDARRIHELTTKIEKRVKKEIPQIDSFSVAVEIFASRYRHLVFPVEDSRELDSRLAENFGRSTGFLFVNLKEGKVQGYYYLKNPYQGEKARAGLKAAKLVTAQKAETVVTRRIGEIAFHYLRDQLFDFYRGEEGSVREKLKELEEGTLKPLTRPEEAGR